MKDPRLDRPPEPKGALSGRSERKTRAAIGHWGGGRLAAERTSSMRVGALVSRAPSTQDR
jgi:hypothetical protein